MENNSQNLVVRDQRLLLSINLKILKITSHPVNPASKTYNLIQWSYSASLITLKNLLHLVTRKAKVFEAGFTGWKIIHRI